MSWCSAIHLLIMSNQLHEMKLERLSAPHSSFLADMCSVITLPSPPPLLSILLSSPFSSPLLSVLNHLNILFPHCISTSISRRDKQIFPYFQVMSQLQTASCLLSPPSSFLQMFPSIRLSLVCGIKLSCYMYVKQQ